MPRIDEELIAGYLDDGAVARGYGYFRDGHVVDSLWSEKANVLSGHVAGTSGSPYAVSVIFSPQQRPDGRAALLATSCTCPMRTACKHVAALLYAAAAAPQAREPDRPAKAPSAWLAQLTPVTRATTTHALGRARRELGLQLRVQPPLPPTRYAQGTQAPGLHARLVVMGGRDRWVQGGLTWTGLAHTHDAGTPLQRNAIRPLAALHRFDFPYDSRDAWLHLERINAPLLWEVLEQIVAAGVPITLDDRTQTTVTLLPERIDTGIDISRHDAALIVTVPIVVAGEALPPGRFGFIGLPAHGLFTWDVDPDDTTGQPTKVRLARLAEPLDHSLAALAGQPPVRIPGQDTEAFTHDLLPALRAQHPVSSRDGSFELPELPRPVLELHLKHSGQARLELAWGWRYAVPGTDPTRALRLPLRTGREEPTVRRDATAEEELLASLHWLVEDYPHLGAPTATGHRLASIGVLVGLPMLVFARDALPVLERDDRILVTVSGSPIDYREATEAPAITVTATPRDSTRDWLDLSVTVAVDGQEVPFDDLLRALATEQELLILASGTYLRLDQPELQQLRRLIEEARSLQEHVRDGLGVSRYHVDLWAELEQLGVVDTQAAAWRQALASLAEGGTIPARALSPRVDATLRGYQSDGYAWLAHLRDNGLGGVLADDMGLGKTLQTIALIADERDALPATDGQARTGAPWLVVAPTSVVHNWAAEVARFAPSLVVVPISETSAKRGTRIAEAVAGRGRRRRLVHAVPARLRRVRRPAVDRPRARRGAVRQEPPVEGVRMRAAAATCPSSWPSPAHPMENNLMELWSLLSITAPGLFPSPKRFAEYYQRPIERDGRRRATGAPASPHPAVHAAPHQGAGRLRPARRSRSRCSSSTCIRGTAGSTTPTCSASDRRCSGCSTTWTRTASRSSGRSRCCGSSAWTPASSTRSTPGCRRRSSTP